MRRLLKIILANLLLLALGLVTLEWIFGGWTDTSVITQLGIPRDQVLDISVKGLYPHDTPTIRYTRDQYGLRGNFWSPREVDLLTVGGSTTNQLYIGDGETWQDELERQFKAAGMPLTIANAGVDGQSTFGHLADFVHWFPHVPGLRPKYILFYVGLNDYFFSEDTDGGIPEPNVGPGEPRSLVQEIRDRSILWYLWRRLVGLYRIENLDMSHRVVHFEKLKFLTQGNIRNYPKITSGACRGYGKRLRLLAQAAKDLGAKPIFVTQPSRHYRFVGAELQGIDKDFPFGGEAANGVDFYNIIRRYDKTLVEVCTEVGGICIDLDKTGWEDQDFYDYVHMTPAGAKKLAKVMFLALQGKLGES